jgi:hypothetical protein
MNIFKRATLFVVDYWRLVMDAKYNPLRFVGDPVLQTYFMMVLFVMWSVYFGFLASVYLGWANYSTFTSILIHIAVLIPIGFTNAVFRDAERDKAKWLRNWREDALRHYFKND